MFLYLGYKLVFLAAVAIVIALRFSQNFQDWGFGIFGIFVVVLFFVDFFFFDRQHCQLSSLLLLKSNG